MMGNGRYAFDGFFFDRNGYCSTITAFHLAHTGKNTVPVSISGICYQATP